MSPPLEWGDLSPRMRQAAAKALQREELERSEAKRARASHPTGRDATRGTVSADTTDARADRYRCRTCGAQFRAWAAAERHADGHHGAAVDLIYLLPVHDCPPEGED